MMAIGKWADRAERAGEARAARVRLALAEEAQALDGIRASIDGGDVRLEGRGLLDRWIRDAGLRNLGRNG
ncbi:MAG: hypothetical protein AB7E05_00185 [Sphingobium sp.]